MMKKFLLSLFAVVAVVATYAGMKTFSASSDMENDNTIVYVKSNANGNSAITLGVPEEGIGKDGGKGISVVSVAGAAEDWDAQMWLMLPETAPAGTKVSVKFDYKASAAVAVGTQCHGEPGAYMHWGCIGDINFTTEWQTYNGTLTVPSEADGMKSIAFNLSKDKANDVTFYIDNVELSFEKEVREEGEPEPVYDWVDITATEHTVKSSRGDNAGAFVGAFDNEEGIVTLTTQGAQEWDAQFWINFTETLKSNTQVRVSFDCKADHAETIGTQSHANPGEYLHWAAIGDVNFGTEWNTFTWSGKVASEANGMKSIAFNMAKSENAFYIKNIKVEAYIEVPEEVLDETVSPAFINGEEEVVLNDHSAVSVEKAEGLKVGFGDNGAKIKYATYVINELVEDEFMGVVDIIEEQVAQGTLSMNGFGYAEFEEPITFYYGHKYNISIKAWDVTSDNLFDENWNMAAPIASFACEFNGAYDASALAMGQPFFGERVVSGMEIEVADWNGLTISFPENNVATALAGEDALQYGAICLVGTEAYLYEDGVEEAVATESNASEYEYDQTTLFSYFDVEGGKSYKVVIPAGGLKLVNMMKFMGDYEGDCLLWSSDEEIVFEFTTALVKSVTTCLLAGEEEIALNGHSEITAEIAEGLLVAFENMPEAIGVSYAINVMKAIETEEGTTWVADESYDVAVGEAAANGNAFVTFEEPVLFELGQKYQVKITVYAGNPAEPVETVYTYIINGAYDPFAPVVTPALVMGDEEVTLNSHSIVSVEEAEALKVNFENMPEVIGAMYAINVMKAVETEEGTTWVVDESYDVAVGELSMNTIGYAEFEQGVIKFEQGKKYLLKVVAFANADDPMEIGTYTYEFNGSYVEPYLAGDYVIKNVATGMYLNGANAWGTRASITKHGQFMTLAQLEDGKYTIDSHISNGGANHFLGENVFVDSPAFGFTMENIEGNVWAIKNGDKYLTSNSNNTEVNFDAAEANEAAQWMFIEKSDIIAAAAEASVENPVDMTALIGDANFSRNNQYKSQWTMEAGNQNLGGGANENMCAESFHSAFTLTQTLENMPNGLYKVYVQGYYRQDGTDETLPYFYANDATVEFMNVETLGTPAADDNHTVQRGDVFIPNSMGHASNIFAAGEFAHELQVEVVDGTLTIGAKNENTALWVIWDNFELYYCGEVEPEMAIVPAFILGEEETTLNTHSSVSVDMAQALKVNFENMPAVIGASYTIYGMKAVSDEEGTYWNVDYSQELAAGEMSVNAFGYVEFDDILYFEQGQKYQLTVTAYGNPDEPTEIAFESFIIDGAYAPETDIVITPALMLGEEEYTLNNHSAVSVDMADAIKVYFENGSAIRTAMYMICEAVVEDGELTYGEEIASDILSLNNVGYAEFEAPVVFEQGKQYWVRVMAFGEAADNNEPGQIVVPTAIATYECLINGAYVPEIAIVPALIMGEEEMTLNDHSAVSVAEAEAIKVQFENGSAIRTAMYQICEAVVEDGELTYGEEIASDILSLNNFGYAEFAEAIKFEYGKQYWVRIMAFGETPAQDEPGQIVVPTAIATFECLINGSYEAPEELVATDLTREMFHEWDSYEANGNIVGDGGCDYQMGVSTGMPYGNGSVIGAQYADLSKYGTLALTVTEGAPRLLLNRQDMGGSSSDFLEINNPSSPYVTVVGNVWYIDLAKIVEEKGYAHLNVIKGANWANVTITEAKLYVETVDAVGIQNVETVAKNGKFMQNGKVVIVKNGKTYNMNGMIIK